MSVIHPPTYHYNGMPRLMDEFIEALVPPPPTEDEIARKEGWFVDQYDEALEEAYRTKNLYLLILPAFIVQIVVLWSVEYFKMKLKSN